MPLAKRFVDQGFIVKASTRSKDRFSDLEAVGAEPFIVDIDQGFDRLQNFLQTKVLVINITSKNIQGFSELLKLIETSIIDKLIFVSSTSVYDNVNKVISESDGLEVKTKPLSIIEDLLRSSEQFETTIVRFSGLVGGKRDPGNFFRHGRPVKLPNAPVNLIHLDDCLNILQQIIEKNIWGEVFNCCADTHPTKKVFYTQAAQRAGVPLPDFSCKDDDSYKIISNQKVKKSLGYEFIHPDLMLIEFVRA